MIDTPDKFDLSEESFIEAFDAIEREIQQDVRRRTMLSVVREVLRLVAKRSKEIGVPEEELSKMVEFNLNILHGKNIPMRNLLLMSHEKG